MNLHKKRIRNVAFVAVVGYAIIFFMFATAVLLVPEEKDDPASLLVATVFGPALAVAIGMFYALPSVVAYVRKHRNFLPIVVSNIALGWSGLFWVVALIWALAYQKTERVTR